MIQVILSSRLPPYVEIIIAKLPSNYPIVAMIIVVRPIDKSLVQKIIKGKYDQIVS